MEIFTSAAAAEAGAIAAVRVSAEAGVAAAVRCAIRPVLKRIRRSERTVSLRRHHPADRSLSRHSTTASRLTSNSRATTNSAGIVPPSIPASFANWNANSKKLTTRAWQHENDWPIKRNSPKLESR